MAEERDHASERGAALAGELAGQGATIRFEASDLRDIDALKRAFAALARLGVQVPQPALLARRGRQS